MSQLDVVRSNIRPYPTTQMASEGLAPSQHIADSAKVLYDEWVCDRRWLAEDVVRLLWLECKNRGYPLRVSDDVIGEPN